MVYNISHTVKKWRIIMKKSKVMLFGAMALTAGLALAACGSSQ
ncbi:Oligopeptide ABC transporter, periplasmic oligopeptide-binding protein OppA [Streptococcus mitis]|uniref:Oligopeptide ABC transporter, periplasmic oligopeptide-binding protein OppA n=1 Tax=Streptococcus mitis TaxID=28037 RepID=A0A139Q792_STRMT|nr:Oligopeptide ABC transporter, periplasmic oligopeptide-binding protein OppA [Streptococcus mitis]